MDVDYSSLSDQELSQMLKDYGVNVGPVNMATRKVYERKLHKLKTGEAMPTAPKYAPVANDEGDEDDDEVKFKSPPTTRQQPKRPSPSAQPKPPAPSIINRTPEPTQPRLRRDTADIYSPHIDSRPSLSSARKTTLSYETHRPAPRVTKVSNSAADQPPSGGLPFWVKVTALLAILVLVYLIYSNMESNAASNIPKIPSKMAV